MGGHQYRGVDGAAGVVGEMVKVTGGLEEVMLRWLAR